MPLVSRTALVLCLTVVPACRSADRPAAQAAASASAPLATESIETPRSGAPSADRLRTLVVHFMSACCGTDPDAAQRVGAVPLPAGVTVRQQSWGKEGEFDRCYDLAPLTAEARRAFLADVRQAVRGGKLVTVDPDGTCNGRP